MPETSELTSQVYISIGGTEVQRSTMQQIIEVSVDQNAHLPGEFTIHLHDPGLELLDNGPFNLTKEIEIKAAREGGEKVSLIKAEITALEPDFAEGMIAELTVRGYDKSHRLFRETVSKSYLNKKDSDLANEIAQQANLSAEVETTQAVYDHIYQHNQSNLTFLMQRAWRIGFECFVADGKLFFRKPPTNETGLTVTWGNDLLSFRPRITLAEQVDEVIVKGWDADRQEAIVGRASRGNLYPKVDESKDGASWAQSFGRGRLVIVNQPVISQAAANALAAARLDEISGAFIEAEGVAFRRPDLRAGQMIKIEGLGRRFSGSYLITSARHEFTSEGLKTYFAVRGTRTGMLSDQLNGEPAIERWPGVVTALVTNTDDPKDWGRVKVKFPWMSDDAESDWARLIGPGASQEAGLIAVPEVGDEVLVVFEHGDFSRPFILGGLWNGQADIPPEIKQAASGEKPKIRAWRTNGGHSITLYDDSKKKIEITTTDGLKLTLDDSAKKIILENNQVKVTAEQNKIVIDGGTEVEIKSSGNLKFNASGNIDINASGQVTIKGAVINLN